MLQQLSIVDGKFSKDPNGFPKVSFYIQPDETERRYLTDILNIDENMLQSIMEPDEPARIEFEDDYTVFVLKCPKMPSSEDEFMVGVCTFCGFFFHSGKIVVCSRELPPSRRFPGGRDGTRSERLKTQQDIMLRWMSQMIRMFEIRLRDINTRRAMLKEKMSRSPENKNLMDMSDLREGLIYYIDALRGNGHLLERLRAAAGKLKFSQENMELLDDLAIENQQFLEQAQISSQILTGLMDTWTSIINNNISIIMKNMNSLVIAISIPTFFTGLGGMSEFTKLAAPHLKWYASYPLFLVVMAAVSALIYYLVQHIYKIYRT